MGKMRHKRALRGKKVKFHRVLEMKIDVPVFRVYQLKISGENLLIGEFSTKSEAEKVIKQMETVNKFNNTTNGLFFSSDIKNFSQIDESFDDDSNRTYIVYVMEDSTSPPKLLTSPRLPARL